MLIWDSPVTFHVCLEAYVNGSGWKSFLLYHSLLVLRGRLPVKYLKHWFPTVYTVHVSIGDCKQRRCFVVGEGLAWVRDKCAHIITRMWLCYIRVFAIAIPSVVCLSVVCNVSAPYSEGWTFQQYFFTAVYPGHPLTSVQNLMDFVPGDPSIGGVKRKRGIKIQRFWTYRRLYLINSTRQTYSFY